MSNQTLDALLRPSAVALVGASDNAAKLTARPQRFLTQHGYPGRVVPVNPGRQTVLGLPAARSVEAIEGGVEHAYIMLDAEPALEALQECARAGVKVVCMLADGFAEAGPEGKARQRRAVAIAREANMLLIGPNSTGLVNVANGFSCTTNAAFAASDLLPGKVAVLSQSGSAIGMMMSRGAARGNGFSTLVSVGNEAATGVGALGQLLLEDPGTEAFALFLETIRDREALAEFARAAYALGKPVVAYMIGQSSEGQALAVSHTGAMVGSAVAVSCFLDSIGIAQVHTLDGLLDAPGAMQLSPPRAARPRTVTVLTTTGGGGAMLIDQISMRRVEISGCSASARAQLEAKNIPLGHGKLVDVTLAGTKYDSMLAVVKTLIADPDTGMLAVAIGSSAQFNPELAVRPIVDAVAQSDDGAAPVVAVPLPHAPQSLAMLREGGVAAFGTVESAAETIAAMAHGRPPVQPTTDAPPRGAAKLLEREAIGTGALDELASSRLFAEFAIPLPRHLAAGADEGAEIPAKLDFGYPVVAKLISEDLPHKSEAGAVRVGIADAAELAAAVSDMKRKAKAHVPGLRLRGILVQEMCRGLGEALIGVTRDPLVGPVVTLGAGGVLTEIYADICVRPAPVTLEEARRMVDAVKGFEPLRGYRGHARGDLDALARTITDMSRIALLDRVIEAEANPVMIRAEGEGVVVLDALVRLTDDRRSHSDGRDG